MNGATKWIVLIMGFREYAGYETGLERLWKRLRPLGDYSVVVETPYEWDEDLSNLATFIRRNADGPAEVMVIAYSWGCGVGFQNFARKAEELGVRIPLAVLCDPVYRSRFLPTWLPLNPLSVTPILRPKIQIPANVQRVEWFRQTVDFPRGHDLVAADPERTIIGSPTVLDRCHTLMDDSEEFHQRAECLATVFAHNSLGEI